MLLTILVLSYRAALAEPKVRVHVNDRRSGVAYFIPHDAPASNKGPSVVPTSEKDEVRRLLMEEIPSASEEPELTSGM